jgi:hypothetical protein
VNIVPHEEWLSPILREDVNTEELQAVGVSEDTGLLEFGKLGALRDS